MKLIKTGLTEIEAGDIVRIVAEYTDLPVGSLGIVNEIEINIDGVYRVYGADNWDYVKADGLELFMKADGTLAGESEKKTVTVELSIAELKHIVADTGAASHEDTVRGLRVHGFEAEDEVGSFDTYNQLKEILQEVV